ncbi:hypothetical protein AQUCO_00700510v1 [Aquilegia coerulea]|uniref:Glucose-1-phosphate adenylyltransferase/Bifunctional protein GlmU-like C-terminal hexapeptide domain-containing protein n=1 Tax=Aquilegia coerulea TaxID=218851 RepID=A0A2G5EKH5_AQUCA|nr:hypothetical protein AQUCO_00700510v1 [Aquilegia coerulea]
MTVAVRKLAAFSARASYLMPIGRWTEDLCLSFSNYRHFSESSSEQIGSKDASVDVVKNFEAVNRDCAGHLGFEKWDNGGGLVHKSAEIDPTALIEIGAVVHSKSVLGPNVHIGSGAIVGPAVTIGQLTKIGYNAALSNCSIGDSCIIHNGACIGQDGFGFFVDDQGNMLKKHQVGDFLMISFFKSLSFKHYFRPMLYARIGNYVEIGANTCIDRGSWRDTVIGEYTKIDNLVQVGHNVVIGRCCMLCGQVGIAGSVMCVNFNHLCFFYSFFYRFPSLYDCISLRSFNIWILGWETMSLWEEG